MNPSWCTALATGFETGDFLAVDMGGTNLRVCEIKLLAERGKFDLLQSKYRNPRAVEKWHR